VVDEGASTRLSNLVVGESVKIMDRKKQVLRTKTIPIVKVL
jgi:hypothetical protein